MTIRIRTLLAAQQLAFAIRPAHLLRGTRPGPSSCANMGLQTAIFAKRRPQSKADEWGHRGFRVPLTAIGLYRWPLWGLAGRHAPCSAIKLDYSSDRSSTACSSAAKGDKIGPRRIQSAGPDRKTALSDNHVYCGVGTLTATCPWPCYNDSPLSSHDFSWRLAAGKGSRPPGASTWAVSMRLSTARLRPTNQHA